MKISNTITQYLLYPLALRVYQTAIFGASFFSDKAKKWRIGRQSWQKKLLENTSHLPPNCTRIWIHSASLGEFEQARPIIDALKKTMPNCYIICTFFSPSGYEIRKNYPQADWVSYLPLDTKENASFWVQNLQPHLVLWVKYDIWINFLTQLHRQNIPTLLFSAIFRKKQLYFQSYGGFFAQALRGFNHIFVQNNSSLALLKAHQMHHCSLAPDTRFDRVWQNKQNFQPIEVIHQFKNNKKILVAGSTWHTDEILLLSFIHQQTKNSTWKFIIAPHEIDAKKIAHLQTKIKLKTVLFSELSLNNAANFEVLIIDCIGLLANVYAYGDLAYIGGGFGVGIHNILEPAVFNLPIIFGKKYQKFEEAHQLIAQKGAIAVGNAEELEKAVHFFEENTVNNQKYIEQNIGGTNLVLQKVRAILQQ